MLSGISNLGSSESLRLELELPSAAWHVGDEVTLFLLLENWSASSLVIALGNHSPGTSCSAALAAAGLRCEVHRRSGETDWVESLILEPRGANLRQRAIFMPPWQATRLPLVGAVVSAGSFSGPAIRFGGQRGDAAEILLPLSEPGREVSSDSWPLRPRLRFVLQGLGRELATNLGPICFVGPHEPREATHRTATWKGQSQSEPLQVTVSVGPGKRKELTREQVAARERAIVVWQTKLHHASEREIEEARAAQKPVAKKAKAPKRAKTPLKREGLDMLKREAGAAVTRAVEDAVDSSTRRSRLSTPASRPASRPTTSTSGPATRAATSSAPSSAVPCSDLDFEAVPGSASAADSDLGEQATFSGQDPCQCRLAERGVLVDRRAPAELQKPRSGSLSARLPALSSLEHCSKWRGLGRMHDLMADPSLLQLAEEVATFLGPSSTVAICGEWLQSRTGRRFVEAVRSLGARVLPVPTARSLHAWASRPRETPAQLEELVLVAKWQSLSGCVAALRKAVQERPPGSTSLLLRGAVALCERCEEEQATLAATSSDLHCRWRVIPSLAF